MKIGIGLPNQVTNVRPSVIPEWASQAEEAGFSSLGTLGRIAYPGVLDTIALAAAAGATRTIGLVTTVLLAPTYPPELLAKELANIDGISGGRLTVGVGMGGREDDFTVEGAGPRGTGKRMNSNLETYRSVWNGEPFGGGTNAAVPAGTREVPMLFGGFAPAALKRMATWGQGYVGASMPAEVVAGSFDAARAAWTEAGRAGSPRLVAIAYFALGDVAKGRANIRDYYSVAGDEFADSVAAQVSGSPDVVRNTVKSFEDIGTDELILISGLDDVDEVTRLAEIVL
jgi:alkanesulfonate monooxygenase SsuD/methylene tetrahydromethanopterin reductase-like flavin-dependent oxidoreductase (luciferase family)